MASTRNRLLVGALVAGMTAATAQLVSSTPASAVSADVVIAEVYGGGGNSGATFTNDFVELYNRGSAPVDLTGWSVQYAAAAGTTWQATSLSGTLAAGARYLVQEAQGAGGTQALPTPDATGTIAMSATAGKIALVTSTTRLSCGTACHAAPGVRDFVGFGTANDFEGTAAAPGPSNTTSDNRNAAGTDTDSNAADFTTGAPSPQNSAGGGGGNGGIDGLRIHDVQGAAQQSPYAGKTVNNVTGVVTAVSSNGFWMQDPLADADPATSEGIFVFTGSAPTVTTGDAVKVTARVSEFRPGSSTNANLTTTELGSATVTVTASGQPLPAATLVGPGGRVPPSTVIENDVNGSIETSNVFDPAQDGIDFWESMEGMRVELDDAQVVGPTNQFGETTVVPQGSGIRTSRGGIVSRADDFNPERVVIASTLASVPAANVGDSYAGATVGVLDYNFGNFFLLPTSSPVLHSGGLTRETTRATRAYELSVATFNVENLSPLDPQSKFDRLADYAVHNLAAPDILTLEEIQDNDGPTDDGVVAADQTLQRLVDAIAAAGGPAYQWRSIDPVDDQDGGQPGGNIRVAFLFRTDRGLAFVDRPGGDSTTADQVVVGDGGKPQLTLSPGRIDPTNAAWTSSRKPLAGEFSWQGRMLFVIANHFNSKGGDDPLVGRFQPPAQPSATQRHQQATLVHDFVSQIEGIDPAAAVVVLGDLNDFDFTQTIDILTAGDVLLDLPRTLPDEERYTYDFEGNSEVLDHILLSPGLSAVGRTSPSNAPKPFFYDVVHVNSEFADQASDHDPQVVKLWVHSPLLVSKFGIDPATPTLETKAEGDETKPTTTSATDPTSP
ncbi:MAG: lamin tail domain-containing protein [Frankiaceae bacterium]